MKELYFPDEAALTHYAASLAQRVPTNFTFYLHGDLGAGKTTFVRGFLQGLGFEGLVKSPTYALVEIYQIDKQVVYHFDLYRIEEPEMLSWIGIDDYAQEQALRFVEWPEKGGELLFPADVVCGIAIEDEGRRISLEAASSLGKQFLGE